MRAYTPFPFPFFPMHSFADTHASHTIPSLSPLHSPSFLPFPSLPFPSFPSFTLLLFPFLSFPFISFPSHSFPFISIPSHSFPFPFFRSAASSPTFTQPSTRHPQQARL